MCRFALYLGPEIKLSSLVTEPANSIINQSIHSQEQEEPLNGDGFGLAWYVPKITDNPALFKDVTPAWNNLNLLNLARVTTSSCILAHVRAATPGLPVIRLNCHPFSWNKLAFMHNGRLGGFQRYRRTLLGLLSDEAFQMISGSTDSEHLFALFTDHYRRKEGQHQRTSAMAEALDDTIAQVEQLRMDAGVNEPSLLNLVVSDGRRAVASRYISWEPEKANSLYYCTGTQYVCSQETCRMVTESEENRAIIIASERLGDEPGWFQVPFNSIVLIDADRSLEIRQIS